MDMGVLTVHLSDVEHGGDIGDVEHGSDMSPLSGSHDITHDDVSQLEHEAVTLASADISHDEEDDDNEDNNEEVVNADGADDEEGQVGQTVVSAADNGILIHAESGHAIVGGTSQVIGLLLQSSHSAGVPLSSGVKLSVTGMLSEGTVVTDPTHTVQAIQAVTLPDGSTAFIQQPKEGKLLEGQTVTLEDGTTAIVQGTIHPKVEPQDDSKVLEGQTIRLEGQTIHLDDGSTAFLQPSSKTALSEGLQAIRFEDGTTAFIAHPNAETLFDESGALDSATLDTLTQLGVTSSKQQMTVEKALAIGEKAYKCGYEDCGRLYTTLHHLKVHERSHTGDRPFKCEYPTCGKAFATGYGLKSHTRVHTGEKPYPCTEEGCDKAFKTSGDLQKHVRTHTGERPFKCPFEGCTRSFTTSNIRKVHIRTHTGERPYICQAEGCGRAFASATNYKNHVRIHTGEKPYVCTVQGCGKRFTEYSSLYKHHVVHTHSKPYSCNHCGKTYRQTSTLAMHKRTSHGEDILPEAEAQLFAQEQGDGDEEHGETPSKRQRLQFAMSEADNQSGGDETEKTLVINTDSQQNSALVTLPAQVTLQALQSQGLSSFTVGQTGHQVLVVTDPAQLEALQQLAQQHLEGGACLKLCPLAPPPLLLQRSPPSATCPASPLSSSFPPSDGGSTAGRVAVSLTRGWRERGTKCGGNLPWASSPP
ncbi:zinc finger protein 76-like isoform X1 [Pomacea canaliculata]|uniref:zinc finger protein 76-like isoform X1 n=1 Tax=Pomacea canaliculata TaxID=400727 RepID=UPI000D735143|nr:zinc finger protein 76-like isoform X1 [Pomacea canaliculata]